MLLHSCNPGNGQDHPHPATSHRFGLIFLLCLSLRLRPSSTDYRVRLTTVGLNVLTIFMFSCLDVNLTVASSLLILFCTVQTQILGSRWDSLTFLASIIGTWKGRKGHLPYLGPRQAARGAGDGGLRQSLFRHHTNVAQFLLTDRQTELEEKKSAISSCYQKFLLLCILEHCENFLLFFIIFFLVTCLFMWNRPEPCL